MMVISADLAGRVTFLAEQGGRMMSSVEQTGELMLSSVELAGRMKLSAE